MAREEVDREDLLRDAVALVRRIELKIPDETAPVVVGFRQEGAASFYFGADPAIHFNSRGELRRAYSGDRLLKAEQGRLVSLRRSRTGQTVELLRTDLTDEQTDEITAAFSARLTALRRSLAERDYRIVGQVPADEDIVGEAAAWLGRLEGIRIAAAPGVC